MNFSHNFRACYPFFQMGVWPLLPASPAKFRPLPTAHRPRLDNTASTLQAPNKKWIRDSRQNLVGGPIKALHVVALEPLGCCTKETRLRAHHGQLQETEYNEQLWSAHLRFPRSSRPVGHRMDCFPSFKLVSPFHQMAVREDSTPLTSFCTAMCLFECLGMPSGGNRVLG